MKLSTYKTPLHRTLAWVRYLLGILALAVFLALLGLSQSGCAACVFLPFQRGCLFGG